LARGLIMARSLFYFRCIAITPKKTISRRWPFGQKYSLPVPAWHVVKGIDFSTIIRYFFLMKPTAIIPARYGSTRLPGKPLIMIKGKPLIQYVYERVQSSSVQHVIVATDDERIAAAVRGFGGEAALTSPHHRSGTERVAEVAAGIDADIVVNVQGDEPLIQAEAIDDAIAPFAQDPSIMVTTLITPLVGGNDLCNPHVVKVTVDHDGFALYFSRAPIPYPRNVLEKMAGGGPDQRVTFGLANDEPRMGVDLLKRLDKPEVALWPKGLKGYWQHIGLYAFQRAFLLKLTALPPSRLEKQEGLEQLRILENGYRIKTIICSSPSIGIDTPEDVERFTALI
jgi:3-deoxy-manno-octulosonate cytidylyltransferase (CMP-KDO synthetase)